MRGRAAAAYEQLSETTRIDFTLIRWKALEPLIEPWAPVDPLWPIVLPLVPDVPEPVVPLVDPVVPLVEPVPLVLLLWIVPLTSTRLLRCLLRSLASLPVR